MKELLKAIEYMQNYGQALEDGVNKFVDSLPIFTGQHIKQQAKKKLDSTFDTYMDAVSVKTNDYVLVVELDRDNWLANAVESGVGQFDLKETILNSPKAKVSKKGFRYMSIPMGQKQGKKPGTDKGKEFQQKIEAVLMKPKFGIKRLKTLMNGTVMESQQVLTPDPMFKGLYRSRQYESPEEYHSGKKKPQWQFILFKTISENPISKTGATWQHPGIRPVYIMKNTERWLESEAPELLKGFIEAEIDSLNKSFFGGGE